MSAEPIPERTSRVLGEGGLITVCWVGVGLALVFIVLRCFERRRTMNRLLSDDYWMLAAFTLLVAAAVLQTFQTASLFYLVRAAEGEVPIDERIIAIGDGYSRYEFAIIVLFWTTVWCVKASLLALAWRLFEAHPTRRIIWWFVAVFNVLAYIGGVVINVFDCHPSSTWFEFGKCFKPIDASSAVRAIVFCTVVDVVTDLMVMALLVSLLGQLRINIKQKMGVAGVFSLGLIIITTSVIRLSQTMRESSKDPVGLALWSIVEASIAVTTGCLPPLKSMFTGVIKDATQMFSTAATKVEEQGSSIESTMVNSLPLVDTRGHSQLSLKDEIDFERDVELQLSESDFERS